eukprot:Mrub_03485.p1 GENE.Mrub_03485~~Mrub_03485.p1  ORF type:complete len:473 (+),score=37.23 Mrub_03485:37-1419(+)
MLENEFGYEAINACIEMNKQLSLNLKMTYILVSSSEERDVLAKYEELGVEFFVKKPLNKNQLELTIKYFNEKIIINDRRLTELINHENDIYYKSTFYNKYINYDPNSINFEIKLSRNGHNDSQSIWINIDDESSILKMNTRVCSKGNINLNLCTKKEEFLIMLGYIYNNYYLKSANEEEKPHIVLLSDHMLENEFGYEAINACKEMNEQLSLNLAITYILVSSSEERDVLAKYEELGVELFIKKPLNKIQLEHTIKYINDKIDKNARRLTELINNIDLNNPQSKFYSKYIFYDLNSINFEIKITRNDNNNSQSIWINIDDESSILKMNTRVCNKGNINLNLCTKKEEFLIMIGYIYNNYYLKSANEEEKPHIVLLSDHMLENEFGYEAINACKEMNEQLSLNLAITYILVSSSEERDVLAKYEELGVELFIKKPFNIRYCNEIKEFLEKYFNNYIDREYM